MGVALQQSLLLSPIPAIYHATISLDSFKLSAWIIIYPRFLAFGLAGSLRSVTNVYALDPMIVPIFV
jgi:hypothetical protein